MVAVYCEKRRSEKAIRTSKERRIEEWKRKQGQ
jgi:hypothetical protein